MDIKKILLLFAFINKKFNLIKILLRIKYNINLKIKTITSFFKFYYKDFNALLNFKTNQKINGYKILLFNLLKAKSNVIIDFTFLIVLLYLLFIMKLLEFNKKINNHIIKKYCSQKECYLNNLDCIINNLKLNEINYNKFINCNFKVTTNNFHLMKK